MVRYGGGVRPVPVFLPLLNMQANARDHNHKLAHNFKYGYSVNIDVEKGQEFGTFNVINRDKTGVFYAIHGSGFSKVAAYYTDEMVTDDPASRLHHFTNVMDVIEGRKSNKALGVLVRQAGLEDNAEALKNVLAEFGANGSVNADRINLASEIVAAAKEGANLDMKDYL